MRSNGQQEGIEGNEKVDGKNWPAMYIIIEMPRKYIQRVRILKPDYRFMAG